MSMIDRRKLHITDSIELQLREPNNIEPNLLFIEIYNPPKKFSYFWWLAFSNKNHLPFYIIH